MRGGEFNSDGWEWGQRFHSLTALPNQLRTLDMVVSYLI